MSKKLIEAEAPKCDICGVEHGTRTWRHPELYHIHTTNATDGARWYGINTPHSTRHSFLPDVQKYDIAAGDSKRLCQHCRSRFEDERKQAEKVREKNRRNEARGQMKLPFEW